LWHADHKIPVWEGGGECGIENMRTLCVCCHAVVTASQAKERAKRKGKRQEEGMEARAEEEREKARQEEEEAGGAEVQVGQEGSMGFEM
jgi:hypothetical protein